MTVDLAADIAWGLRVKLRAGHRCQRCGYNGPHIEAAHIFSRGIQATRYDPENGVCLCAGPRESCHHWAHQNPRAFIEWASDWLGQHKFEALRARARHLEKRVPRPT